MLRIIRMGILCIATVSFIATLPAEAKNTLAPPAPMPVQLRTATKIFISNGSGTSFWDLGFSSYDEFYAAMKSWGKYELLSAPADADLVFEIRNQEPYLNLVIMDTKTHVVLWTADERVLPATLESGRQKNFKTAMTTLVEDVKRLTLTTAPPVQVK